MLSWGVGGMFKLKKGVDATKIESDGCWSVTPGRFPDKDHGVCVTSERITAEEVDVTNTCDEPRFVELRMGRLVDWRSVSSSK